MNLWDKFTGSFENSPIGFSARKLSAFTTMGLIIYAHYKHLNDVNFIYAIIIDSLLLLLLLGLITFQQVIEFKNGGKPPAQ